MKFNYKALTNFGRYALVLTILAIALFLLAKPSQTEQGENYSNMCNGCRQVETCSKLDNSGIKDTCEKVDNDKQEEIR